MAESLGGSGAGGATDIEQGANMFPWGADMISKLGRKGFSIVELLVTLAVSGVLVALLSQGYIAQKRSSEGESDLRDMNLKTQLAMNQIKQILRNAGLGAEENLTKNTGLLNGTNVDFSSVFTITPRDDGPDALTVVTGYPARTRVVCPGGTCSTSVIDVLDAAAFDTDTGRYIFVAPSIQNQYHEVTSVSDNTLTLDQSITVHNDDPVYRINAYTITLDADGDGTPLDVDGDGSTLDGDQDPAGVEVPDLYIYDNRADMDDESEAKIVEGVEDLQFQFLLDTDDNDILDAAELSTWHDDVPAGNLDDIRAVRVWLLVRSSRPDPNHEDAHEEGGTPHAYQVADHEVLLDTSDANGIDSMFDYRYHRLLSVETVMVRNRNL